MNVLVCVQEYPDNNGRVTLMYVHTRNLYYVQKGINVTVLNFNSKQDYYMDGIAVITFETYINTQKEYDILICHAANLRSHYIFLKKYGDRFPQIVFFYHGHEVMRINRDYATPYSFVKKNLFKNGIQAIYDEIKIRVWRKFFKKNMNKCELVFVSKWMRDTFLRNMKIPTEDISARSQITYNSVGQTFETDSFNSESEKNYDFITVRNNLDGSKYAIDVVNRLAFNTPDKNFLVVGKGEFFAHYEKAPNLTWQDRTLSHMEIVGLMNESCFALMPTRTDAQGLMMCEMAAFGIPVITSDIDVCHEVFDDFENIYYINNDDIKANLSAFTKEMSVCKKHKRFYKDCTVEREVELLMNIYHNRT